MKSIYMSKSLTNKLFLKKQLYFLKMVEGLRLSEHLHEFNKIVTQLVSFEVEIEDEDKALLFLFSLPPIVRPYGYDTNVRK